MKYSFIVIGPSQEKCRPALKALEKLQITVSSETLISIGCHPSQQRNEAASRAKGEYLVFLDNDSCPDPLYLQKVEEAFRKFPEAGVIGGPSIYRSQSNSFKFAANLVLTSPLGMGPFRSRYQSTGDLRETSERELILSNLIIRRALFLASGGFRRDLYPNEENELLLRLAKKTKIFYHPEAVCYREPRENIFAFAKQFFWYGHGRAKHYLFMSPRWNIIFLIPTLFAIYFGLLLLAVTQDLSLHVKYYLAIPTLVYFCLAMAESIRKGWQFKRFVWYNPVLFWICHFSYGLGFFTGLPKRLFQFGTRVLIEKPD